MHKFLPCIFFLISQALFAQRSNHFNITFGIGASYFFNDESLKRHLDNTRFMGMSYQLGNKNQSMSFNPGLVIQVNDYHARLENRNLVHVAQHIVSLTPEVLLRLSKRSYLRVGLIFNRIYYSNIEISWEYNGRNNMSNSDYLKGYSAADNQAGASVGTSLAFKLLKREHKFNIKILYIASRLINEDFYMSKAVVGEDVKVLSIKARPLMLSFGFDISLIRLKKPKKEEEEN